MSKKIPYKILLILLIVLLALEGSVVILNDFFFEKVAAREIAARQMPKETANAVKHAYAASLLYSGFRTIFLSKNAAKSATIFFGKVNEVAEIVFKTNPDSTLEMMKDLENNLIGIVAAEWLEENHNDNRIGFIGDLAEKKILILSYEDVVLPDEEKRQARISADYFMAVKWFEENRGEIEKLSQLETHSTHGVTPSSRRGPSRYNFLT